MKLFISWSGELSHRVALALRDWLPQVINVLEPYVSSKDIKAGEQWFSNVRKELESSSYGIICLSRENLRQPWLLFEAGALSTSMTRSRVVPFLIDVSPSDLYPPLSEFQAVTRSKNDVLHLLLSLHKDLDVQQLKEGQLEKAFKVWWNELDESIELSIKETPTVKIKPEKRESSKKKPNTGKERLILEEVLNNTRALLQTMEDFLSLTQKPIKAKLEPPKPKVITPKLSPLKLSEIETNKAPAFLKSPFLQIEKKAVEMLKQGNDPNRVMNQLTSKGIPAKEAAHIVNENKPDVD